MANYGNNLRDRYEQREKCNRLTKKLKELGINPILIPKNENIPHLVNPIKDILKKD